jgi:hypothetical protein
MPTSREDVLDKIQALSPKDDKQHSLQAQALGVAVAIGRTRWLKYQQLNVSVSKALLAAMVFWLTVVFFSFGIFAPHNGTAVASLFAAGVSVSGAILLILDMYTPYATVVQISSAPIRSALLLHNSVISVRQSKQESSTLASILCGQPNVGIAVLGSLARNLATTHASSLPLT